LAERVKTMIRTKVLLLALALTVPPLATAARAQTRYALPEPTNPATGAEVRIRLMSGVPFAASELSVAELRDVRLDRLWRSGRVELDFDDAGGVATFRVAAPGVQLIAYSPRGEAGSATEVASFGKALVVVGPASRKEQIWRSELGQRLEIVPATDPVALLESGGTLEVQILFRREPLAGATVVAVAEDAPAESYKRAVTDTLGRVRFDLDRSGRWLIHLAHKGYERGDDPGWTLFQSSLLLVSGP
jgi:hypothetical protein